MEFDNLASPPPGAYPYRYTDDDRFQFRVRVQPVAGHLEFFIRAVDTRLPSMAADRAWHGNPKRQYNWAQDSHDRHENQLKATQRAQRKIRLLCMEAGVDRMFTFTTRGFLDRDTLLKVWDYFRRVMEKQFRNFRYVATIEHHKSGQLHIHAGLHGFYNINHLRKIWHTALNRVLGRPQHLVNGPDSPGNVNIPPSRSKRRKPGVEGSLAIAGYIAKYVGKELVEAFNRKRYLHTKNVKITPAQAQWLKAESLFDALLEAAEKYSFVDHIDTARHFNGSVFLRVHVDDLPPPPF